MKVYVCFNTHCNDGDEWGEISKIVTSEEEAKAWEWKNCYGEIIQYYEEWEVEENTQLTNR